jgi:hypothetical protein
VTRTPISKLVETVEAVETIQRQLEDLTAIVEKLAVRLNDREKDRLARPSAPPSTRRKP